MSEKLSRRLFLKMAAALGASGALAWKSDDLKADDSPVMGVDLATEGTDETVMENPFGVYFSEGPAPFPATFITWGDEGEEIITRYGDGDTND